jgi:hypothetical protein
MRFHGAAEVKDYVSERIITLILYDRKEDGYDQGSPYQGFPLFWCV